MIQQHVNGKGWSPLWHGVPLACREKGGRVAGRGLGSSQGWGGAAEGWAELLPLSPCRCAAESYRCSLLLPAGAKANGQETETESWSPWRRASSGQLLTCTLESSSGQGACAGRAGLAGSQGPACGQHSPRPCADLLCTSHPHLPSCPTLTPSPQIHLLLAIPILGSSHPGLSPSGRVLSLHWTGTALPQSWALFRASCRGLSAGSPTPQKALLLGPGMGQVWGCLLESVVSQSCRERQSPGPHPSLRGCF